MCVCVCCVCVCLKEQTKKKEGYSINKVSFAKWVGNRKHCFQLHFFQRSQKWWVFSYPRNLSAGLSFITAPPETFFFCRKSVCYHAMNYFFSLCSYWQTPVFFICDFFSKTCFSIHIIHSSVNFSLFHKRFEDRRLFFSLKKIFFLR